MAYELAARRAAGTPAWITRPDGYFDGTTCPRGVKGTLPATAWFLDCNEPKPLWWSGPLPLLRGLVGQSGRDWHPCGLGAAYLVAGIDSLALTTCNVLTTHVEVAPGDRTPHEWLARKTALWGWTICLDIAAFHPDPRVLEAEVSRKDSPLNLFRGILEMLR